MQTSALRNSNFSLPALSGGAGLRFEHIPEILETNPPFRWFEIITDDFMGASGYPRELLQEVRKRYRIIPHGVCLSIGSTDPLDEKYLRDLKRFSEEIAAPWVSDHLCFTMVDHVNLDQLIPLPFTSQAVQHVVDRIRHVQDIIEKPFLIENVTRYITVSDSEMSELEFLCAVLDKADCGLLLDVTNVHLNAMFHGFDERAFIDALPHWRIGQMHLAGWDAEPGAQIIDSHDARVPDQVWSLFRYAIGKTGPTSALVEWDKELPSVRELLAEADRAHHEMQQALKQDEEKGVHGAC